MSLSKRSPWSGLHGPVTMEINDKTHGDFSGRGRLSYENSTVMPKAGCYREKVSDF